MTMTLLAIKAQEEKLRGLQGQLWDAQTEAEAASAFRKINQTSNFIRHLKANGFMGEAR